MAYYLVEAITKNAALLADKEAFRYKQDNKGSWISLNWSKFSQQVMDASYALCQLGAKPHDKIGIFSQNRKDMFVTDFAAYRNSVVVVPIYATSSKEQVEYIANDAQLQALFVGDQEQYHIARRVQLNCKSLKQIVVYEDSIVIDSNDESTITFEKFMEQGATASDEIRQSVAHRVSNGNPNDLACLIYTSGTTGVPKGVQLTHKGFGDAMQYHIDYIGHFMKPGEVSLNFLPVSHIFERGWSYVCICTGVAVAVNTNPKEVTAAVREIKPNYMCSVPRFWEKVYTTIENHIDRMPSYKRAFIRHGLEVGRRRNMEYVRFNRKVPYLLERQYQFYENMVFSRLRDVIGMKDSKFLPTAGAPIASQIVEMLQSVGLNIVVGYGLTETLATVSLSPIDSIKLGSIGKPIPGVKVKIDPSNNEILVLSPGNMTGYYNKPEETAKIFTEDGYLRTGDAGYLDKDGNLFITERIKDLFKTSNGKYIAPQALESRLGACNCIEQIAVIGDQRKFVSALIYPNYADLEQVAKEMNIKYAQIEDLADNADIKAYIEQEIEKQQEDLASFERIKRFTLLKEPFTMESGELTNTLKVRRNVVCKKYADIIDSMYQ